MTQIEDDGEQIDQSDYVGVQICTPTYLIASIQVQIFLHLPLPLLRKGIKS